jgi:Tol biopolymer transport system component
MIDMNKQFLIVGIIACIVVAVIGAYFFMQPGPGGEGEIIEPTLTQVTFLSGDAGDPTWSPDGSQIAFADFAANSIGIINADGTGLRYLDIGGIPNWSPVENKLAVTGGEEENLPDSGISLIDLDTENVTFLVSGDLPSWSPDGTKIAYASGEVSSSSIWVMNSDGSGTPTQLTTSVDGSCTGPSFSYDGSKIVYLKGPTDYGPMGEFIYGSNEIWVMNSDGSNKHQIYAPADISSLIFGRAWNKDNKILFMHSVIHEGGSLPSVWVINSDGSDPHPIVQNPSYLYGDPVWSNDGTKVAICKIDQTDVSNIYTFSYEEEGEG